MTESGMMKTEFLMGIWIMQMNPSLLSTKTERSGTGTETLQNRQREENSDNSSEDSSGTEDISDPFDLYSWDAGTGQYIPFQQAETDASPVGRGNSWYYYDEERSELLPW